MPLRILKLAGYCISIINTFIFLTVELPECRYNFNPKRKGIDKLTMAHTSFDPKIPSISYLSRSYISMLHCTQQICAVRILMKILWNCFLCLDSTSITLNYITDAFSCATCCCDHRVEMHNFSALVSESTAKHSHR